MLASELVLPHKQPVEAEGDAVRHLNHRGAGWVWEGWVLKGEERVIHLHSPGVWPPRCMMWAAIHVDVHASIWNCSQCGTRPGIRLRTESLLAYDAHMCDSLAALPDSRRDVQEYIAVAEHTLGSPQSEWSVSVRTWPYIFTHTDLRTRVDRQRFRWVFSFSFQVGLFKRIRFPFRWCYVRTGANREAGLLRLLIRDEPDNVAVFAVAGPQGSRGQLARHERELSALEAARKGSAALQALARLGMHVDPCDAVKGDPRVGVPAADPAPVILSYVRRRYDNVNMCRSSWSHLRPDLASMIS